MPDALPTRLPPSSTPHRASVGPIWCDSASRSADDCNELATWPSTLSSIGNQYPGRDDMSVDEAAETGAGDLMDRVMQFLHQFVGDLGATIAAGGVVIGHELGLYQALVAGPATPAELAERTGTDVRYVTEWARGQASGGYVTCQPEPETYSLTEEQAFMLTD